MEGKRNIAYKFRLDPNPEQRGMLAKTFGCCRFIWNHMLADKIAAYKKTGKMKRTTPAAYKNEYSWLKEVDSLALANVQRHLERAYKSFFENPVTGYPRFKTKHYCKQTYTTNVVNGNIRLEDGRLRLPKIGRVKIVQHREIPENYILKSVTVSAESCGRYYASLLFEYAADDNQVAEKSIADCRILGIDYAMRGLAVFSDGTRADYPGYYRKSEAKLSREQRRLSNCRKGSNNYLKQRESSQMSRQGQKSEK